MAGKTKQRDRFPSPAFLATAQDSTVLSMMKHREDRDGERGVHEIDREWKSL
jgi:hypothetical protein